MKALSLTQPWATLVATGQKTIETRSWSTRYRGPLLIHAAKGFPAYAKEFSQELYGNPAVLPYITRGAIIGKVYLLDVRPTEEVVTRISVQERRYGDYSQGRYAWILTNPEQLEPIPWKGALGLFKINGIEHRSGSAIMWQKPPSHV